MDEIEIPPSAQERLRTATNTAVTVIDNLFRELNVVTRERDALLREVKNLRADSIRRTPGMNYTEREEAIQTICEWVKRSVRTIGMWNPNMDKEEEARIDESIRMKDLACSLLEDQRHSDDINSATEYAAQRVPGALTLYKDVPALIRYLTDAHGRVINTLIDMSRV